MGDVGKTKDTTLKISINNPQSPYLCVFDNPDSIIYPIIFTCNNYAN